jgi:hypothetical protein
MPANSVCTTNFFLSKIHVIVKLRQRSSLDLLVYTYIKVMFSLLLTLPCNALFIIPHVLYEGRYENKASYFLSKTIIAVIIIFAYYYYYYYIRNLQPLRV